MDFHTLFVVVLIYQYSGVFGISTAFSSILSEFPNYGNHICFNLVQLGVNGIES